jgi:hypothetical protein
MIMTNTKLNRRRFLLAMGAGGAGVAAVALTKGVAQRAENTAADDKSMKTTRYQLSEHIENYYRTARV